MVPKSKKELFERIATLVGTGKLLEIPPDCGKGTGAPGHFLEKLLGSDGSNKAIADTVGVEVKFHSSAGCLLTLLHKEVHGGNTAILPMVRKFGSKNKDGLLSFRCTVTDSSPFRVARSDGKVIIRPKTKKRGYPEVFWYENDLLTPAVAKLRHVVLVHGQVKKDGNVRFVRYDSAQSLTDFNSTDFLNAIGGKYILVEFDTREKEAGGSVLRNHGTKLRMKVEDVEKIWKTVEIIEPKPPA
jgi:hypothetical protein